MIGEEYTPETSWSIHDHEKPPNNIYLNNGFQLSHTFITQCERYSNLIADNNKNRYIINEVWIFKNNVTIIIIIIII